MKIAKLEISFCWKQYNVANLYLLKTHSKKQKKSYNIADKNINTHLLFITEIKCYSFPLK